MPVLIDFGSARQRLSERSMTVIESAGYTPFEQLQSRGNVGPWSDLYALAATLVKVMTGEAPPKANDRSFGDPWQPLNGRPELAGRFSALLLGSLDRALRLPIEERWQSAEEWQAALKSGKVPEAPVKAVLPEPQSASGERGKPKHRWPLVVAAVWLGLAGAWWLTHRAGSEAPAAILVPSPGGLVITSEPGGAEVLNEAGEMLGSTPLELKGLPGGKAWSGRVEFKNYESSRVVAEVVSGDTRLVPAVKLKATLQKVVVTSQPGGAVVMQGVEQVGETPFELTGVSPGTVLSYRLSLAGHEESMLEGVVKIGEPLVLRAALKPLPKLEGDKPGEEREFEIAPGVTMTMCWIPPGEFVMGSPTTEDGRQDDEAQVKVTLSKGFWLGKYEVTQSQWGALVGANPSHFKGGNLPVETVSWNNAQDFLEKLNARLGSADGGTMALPTEAQWEYAARVGQAGRYAGGSVGSLDDVAWYHGNSGFATHPVGLMKANAWGLHDMSGNVLEWCADWYGDTLPSGLNPKGPASGAYRVRRGGGWNGVATYCRVAYRNGSNPADSRNSFGLRLARSSVP
jgi:formylglycine-generating enzyme required for sulfatase activity